MELRAGYKQTDVGVIPEDWEVRKLSEHFLIFAGGDVPKHSVSQIRSETHPLPIFANALQKKGLYGFTAERRARADSLSITARGYLGHAEYRTEDFFPIVRLLVLEPTGSLDARFTTFAVNERVKFAFESTGVPQLTAPQVGKYSVAAPPLSEQRAIATALSDVDALLAKLDQLIAKKRDLKQAAMQQLLTGQTRLPGFSREWKVKRLGDILRFQVGCPFSSEFFNQKDDGIRLIKNRDLKADDQIFFFNGKFDDAFLVKNGDVLIGMDGDFLPCIWSKGVALLNQRVGRLVVSPRLNTAFAYYMLMDPLKAIENATSATTVKHLSHSDVEGIDSPLPGIEEQTAIASALSDMDAELAALEARRDKTRALKQGMMQALLTGRIRLVGGD